MCSSDLSDIDATSVLGAVPSPETIVEGMNDLSVPLLTLGLAGDKIIGGGTIDSPSEWQALADGQLEGLLPNHKGLYPPKDRISIISRTCMVFFIRNLCQCHIAH